MVKLALLLVCAIPLSNCSGFAAPQTSIPLPENNPVSISGPDSNGIVTLTSAANSNLANAKLIITVNSTAQSQISSELLPIKLLNTIVNSAFAQSVCSTGLTTTCPDLDDNNQCEDTANADGSFSVEIPATASDSISASYLDPTTCEEVVLIEGESIPADVFTLNFEGKFIEWAHSTDSLFILGEDNGAPILVEFNDQTFDVKSSTDLGNVILPSDGSDRGFFEYVEFADDNPYIGLMDGSKAFFLPYSSNMSIDDAITIMAPNFEVADNYRYLTNHRTDISSSNYPNFACSPYTYPSTAARLFFSDNSTNHIYIVDDTSSVSTYLQTRELTFDPSTEAEFSGYEVDRIVDFEPSSTDPSKGVLIFSAIAANDTIAYWAALITISSGLCDGTLPITDLLEMSSLTVDSTENIQFDIITTLIENQPQKWFLIGTENSHFIIFNDDFTVQSDLIEIESLFASAPEEEPRGLTMVPDPNGDPFIHLLLVWNGFEPALSATYSVENNTAVENTSFNSDIFKAIDVLGAQLPVEPQLFVPDRDSFILDSGLEDDNKSFLIFENLDEAL